ncbi:MAG: hypothetical protein V4641_26540, partial [Pseudomonadota bacterium]
MIFRPRPLLRRLLAAVVLAHAVPAAADDLSACRLPEMKVLGDVGLGFPRLDFRLRSTGEVRLRVLFVDFGDAPAQQTPQQVMSIISPHAEQFFQAGARLLAHAEHLFVVLAAATFAFTAAAHARQLRHNRASR